MNIIYKLSSGKWGYAIYKKVYRQKNGGKRSLSARKTVFLPYHFNTDCL